QIEGIHHADRSGEQDEDAIFRGIFRRHSLRGDDWSRRRSVRFSRQVGTRESRAGDLKETAAGPVRAGEKRLVMVRIFSGELFGLVFSDLWMFHGARFLQ